MHDLSAMGAGQEEKEEEEERRRKRAYFGIAVGTSQNRFSR